MKGPSVDEVFSRDGMLKDIVFCVNTAAQLFERQVPTHQYLICWHPLGEDGWIAGEVEGRDVPTHTLARSDAELGYPHSRAEASLMMVRFARLAPPPRGAPSRER